MDLNCVTKTWKMKNEKQIDKSITMTKMKRSISDPNGTMKLKQIKAWNMRLFIKSWLFLEHWQCSFWYTGCTGRRQMGRGKKWFGSYGDCFCFYKIQLESCGKKSDSIKIILTVAKKHSDSQKLRCDRCKNHKNSKKPPRLP